MRKPMLAGLLALCCVLWTPAQDDQTRLEAFLRNFEKAETLSVKLKVLQDSMKGGSQGMGPLYLEAVEYVNSRSAELSTDALLRQMALLASDLAAESHHLPAAEPLWMLFEAAEDSVVQWSILDALGVLAGGSDAVVGRIEAWLTRENTLKEAGQRTDESVIMAAVRALGNLGKESSFSVLFETNNAGYSAETAGAAEEALYSLEGNLKQSFMKVLEREVTADKLAALEMILRVGSLGENDRAELAEKALEMGLETASEAETETARELRRLALNALSERKWADATPVAVDHLNTTIQEYDRGMVGKDYLLEAIYGLGSLGTHDAAKRLALYLELLNTYTEHGKPVDEQIVLAVIDNLRELGDKVAFTNLSYVDYLDYGKKVKKEAQEAIDELKW